MMRTQDIFLKEPSPDSPTIVTILHYNVVRDKEVNEESIFLLNCFLCRLYVKYMYYNTLPYKFGLHIYLRIETAQPKKTK